MTHTLGTKVLWNLSGHLLPSKETEDEMIGWHHQLNRHEFEQVLERVKDREAWHTAVHGLAGSGTIARACVQPLVGELRSHNPQGTAKKKSGSIDLLVEMVLLLDTL